LHLSCKQDLRDNSIVIPPTDSIGLAHYKKALHFYKNYKHDSSYVYLDKALNRIKSTSDSITMTELYFNFARIDYNNYNILSCEHNCVKALEHLPKGEKIYQAYIFSLLGLTAKKKGDYKTALSYFARQQKAYRFKKDSLSSFISYHNNVANVYAEMGKTEYAIAQHNHILNTYRIKEKYPIKYARSLDNKAWLLFEQHNDKGVLPLMWEALSIRKEHKSLDGQITGHMHLANYYKKINTDSTLAHASLAMKIAERINSPHSLIDILTLLSEIDKESSNLYFSQYKQIQDSLLQKERLYKDQVARIRYSATEKEKIINKQKHVLDIKTRRNLWLMISLALALVGSTIIWQQKQILNTKKDELAKANNQLYNNNKQLEQKNKLVTSLQRELHHRAKNNLRIINGFIEDIKDLFKDKVFKEQLTNLQYRIESIKNVHLLLYKNKEITALNLKKYVDSLAQNLNTTFEGKNIRVQNNIDTKKTIELSKSFSIGLIINEFFTNSYKHAFTEQQDCIISIDLEESNNMYSLILKDNGIGLPIGFNLSDSNSFGLGMIKLLSLQIGGQFSIYGDKGVTIKINFPLIGY